MPSHSNATKTTEQGKEERYFQRSNSITRLQE